MSQHDFNIANQTASNARADINNAFKASVSLSSGSTAPSTTYANMLWYDTGNNILKMRTEADDAWINVGYLDQSSNAFRILDDTQVVNTSGTQTGLLGGQTEATWIQGTSTTESLVSPAKIKAAVDASAGTTLLGTLNTTSGTSQVLSGLSLTNYNRLYISADGVTQTSGTNREFFVGSTSFGVVFSGKAYEGVFFIDLTTGIGLSSIGLSASDSGIRTTSTSITFSLDGATFAGGTIRVYGVS
jgi:hypothetical protein